jgi:polyhydroxybutyrate depolymerase
MWKMLCVAVLLVAEACGMGEGSNAASTAGESSGFTAGVSGGAVTLAGVTAGTTAAGTGGQARAGAAGPGGRASDSAGPSSAPGAINAAGRGSTGVAGSDGSSMGAGSGGQPAAAGSSGGAGSASAAAGVSGAASAGSGASGGAGGAANAGVTPSAGCMKNAGRPQGGSVMQSDRIYSFPAAYDGKTPMPLLLALHAAGNPNTQLQSLTKGSKLETEFVRAFPKSVGNAWVYNTDSGKLNAVIDDLLANYCIDTSRMFATGHSSGAQMVVQMLCNGEQRFKAVAPVAASKYCAKLSPVPVLYIQGMMDAQRGGGNGKDVVDVFRASNLCGTTSTPKTDVASCTSTFDRQQVTPGCVTFEGCAVPTLWCSHNDNGYNNTDGRQHGWPCFASSAIADFFLSL